MLRGDKKNKKKQKPDITALHDLITVSFFQYMKKCVHF